LSPDSRLPSLFFEDYMVEDAYVGCNQVFDLGEAYFD
jgi:hypothetical protein